MKSEQEIREQLEASKQLYFDEGCQYPQYVKGWVYALQWVLSEYGES